MMERILLIHTGAFAAGIVLGVLAGIPVVLSFALALIGLLLAGFFWQRRQARLCLLIFAFTVGVAWGQVNSLTVHAVTLPAESAVKISGMVAGRPTITPAGQAFPFLVSAVSGRPWTMKAQVICQGQPRVHYGDILEITGKVLPAMMATNPHQFDYRAFLQRQGIAATVSALYGGQVRWAGENRGWRPLAMIYHLRDRMDSALSCLPVRQANFVAGMLFGDKGGLDYQERDVLSETGLMDAFAVSGMHMGFVVLLAGLMAGLLSLSKWPRLAMVAGVVGFYAAATGGTASVVRSGLMAVIGLLAYNLSSRKDLLTALAAAALVILLISPLAVFDAGFQLSFAAAGGVISLTPVFAPLIPGSPPWRDILAGSLAAQLSMALLIAYYFNVISPAGVIIAILVAWPVGLVIFLGLIALFLATVSIPLATIPLYGAGLIVELIWQAAKLVAALPGSHFVLATPANGFLLIYYGFLLAIPTLSRDRLKPKYCLGLAGLLFLFFLLPPWSNHRLTVTFIDVGQGDCILIRSPAGHQVLIDGGGKPRPSTMDVGQRIVLPFLKSQGISRLDLLINTHPHDDHILGMQSVLAEMAVSGLVIGANFSAHPVTRALEDQAGQKKIPVYPVARGQRLVLEPGVVMEVLNPDETGQVSGEDEENNGSLVLRLSYGAVSFLFTGDAETPVLEKLADGGLLLPSQVLKLSHHGSRDSFAPAFYQAVAPWLVVITVGRNSFGHPAAPVVSYWQQRGVPVYRTDQNGAVTISTDGQELFVQTVKEVVASQ